MIKILPTRDEFYYVIIALLIVTAIACYGLR
jgi:hypothetical protein